MIHKKEKSFGKKFKCRDLIKKRIPILSWLPQYKFSIFLQDLLAGFTVGLTEIPQGIAYAIVAGLTPEYGLYSGLMDGFVYAIFGGCKDLNIGPTSIMSLMLQPHVAHLGADAAILITFLSGCIIFILGLLHLGFVIEFFSYPVIAGFICAGSMQIASSQIKSLLGIPGKAHEFLEAWSAVFANLNQINLFDSLLGITCVLLLVGFKEIRRFGSLQYRNDWSTKRNFLGRVIFMVSLARNALVVIFSTVLAFWLREKQLFHITGNVQGGFPPFGPPPFTTTFNGTEYSFGQIVKSYGPSFVFIPLISVLEAISIAKAFSKGKSLDATQEMIALGLCNILGSFARSMPVTGSFTRSAVNHASGVRTTLAGIFTSLLLLLAIAFLTPSFYYVPKATLAAVIICAMIYLFDYSAFSTIWKSNKLDFIPFGTTFLCCLFISIEYGMLIGIGINLFFVLYASARPKFNIVKEKTANEELYVVTPQDTLLFPAAEYLRDQILQLDGKITIIIDGKYIRQMDVTVAKSFAVLVQELNIKQQFVAFIHFKQSVIDVCVGVDQEIHQYFYRNDNLEDFVENRAIRNQSTETLATEVISVL